MNQNNQLNFIEAAQQLGITLASEDLQRVVQAIQNAYSAGLQDGTTAERRRIQADLEIWKAQSATAEKWRGMALAKEACGNVVQEIQREAMEREREACALLCEGFSENRDWVPGSLWGNIRSEMAAKIRARSKT